MSLSPTQLRAAKIVGRIGAAIVVGLWVAMLTYFNPLGGQYLSRSQAVTVSLLDGWIMACAFNNLWGQAAWSTFVTFAVILYFVCLA